MRFKGKTVIVTGAAKGIGKAVAQAYAAEGADVAVVDNDELKGKETVEQLTDKGGRIIFCRADVSCSEEINRLIDRVHQTFGKIDILINNAGVSRWKSPLELTVEEWDNIINTNLRSVFLCSREAARIMRHYGGSIVNIASTRAFMSEPDSEAYAASKGGIIALTHALALSFSPLKIRVNAISPGWIETGDYELLNTVDHTQHPAGRVGKPEDIARACLYFTEENNDFITGTNLVIDGGMTRKMIYI